MNNAAKTTLISLGALICGALLGRFTAPAPVQADEAAPSPQPALHAAKHRDAPDYSNADLSRLSRRVKELEKQLAARDAESDGTHEERADGGEERRPPNPREMRGPGKWLEELRKNSPEEYVQATNRMAIARADEIRCVQERLDLLASVDTSRMSQKQIENHLRYQELVARQTELRDMLRPGGSELTEEERADVREQLRAVSHEVRTLGRTERDALLKQAAITFGLKGKASAEAVETIKAVIRATDGGGPGGPPGPPPRFRR